MKGLSGNFKPVALALAMLSFGAGLASAQTRNGNDFALYFVEAKTEADRDVLLEDGLNRAHFFRYLQIMEMAEVEGEGIRIIAFEPASSMDVEFLVSKSVSLSILREDPVTKVGDAVAVTGKLAGAQSEENVIRLDGTIVRHKDRLSPKVGKELLGEVAPNAVFYSYTAGSRPVNLSYRDRDLLRHRDQIIEEKGPDGWVEFLETEVARRKKERAAAPPTETDQEESKDAPR